MHEIVVPEEPAERDIRDAEKTSWPFWFLLIKSEGIFSVGVYSKFALGQICLARTLFCTPFKLLAFGVVEFNNVIICAYSFNRAPATRKAQLSTNFI